VAVSSGAVGLLGLNAAWLTTTIALDIGTEAERFTVAVARSEVRTTHGGRVNADSVTPGTRS